jgi:hypothetical protein
MELKVGDYLVAKRGTKRGMLQSIRSLNDKPMYIKIEKSKSYRIDDEYLEDFYIINGSFFSLKEIMIYFYTKQEERELKLKKLNTVK